MHFDLVQSLSLCGDAAVPNDDRTGARARHAWVIDGATDLSPPGLLGAQGGAAWLAATADAAFAMVEGTDLRGTCDRVFSTVETTYARQRRRDPAGAWELPRASFAAVQLVEGGLDIAWAGDCSVLHAAGDVVAWCTPAPSRGAESAQAAALGPGVGAVKLRSPDVLDDRRRARSRPGQRVLGVDAAESAQAVDTARIEVAIGDELLLMSDGFVALVDSYRAHDARSLFDAARTQGLAALGVALRRIEHDDAACLRFARFKVSDDATALWVRVGS